MKPSDIQALKNEPSCAHNGKAKSGCAKAKPGATQGGCCFDGARNALLPISDALHIVHGPIGCAGSSWDNRGSRSVDSDLWRLGMTTDLSDLDVIMGRGERRLFQAIRQGVETYRPAAVFLYGTCVPALQGDDLDTVAKAATREVGVPVIPVDCAGFYGNKNLGNRIAGDVVAQYVIGTREPDALPLPRRGEARVHDVNLIGEWNVGGEFWNVAPLFDELGLRILCTFSGDSRFAEVQTMHRAEASMVVCSKAMIHVARALAEVYDVPFFEGSFYGIADTSRAFRDFARIIADQELFLRTERMIEREERRVDEALVPLRPRLAGKRALVFAGGHKSWAVVAAMQDLGLTVVATGTEKSTEEDQARIHALMGPDALLIPDNDQTALIDCFHAHRADILLAGDRYIYPTLKSRIPFLDLDHVRRIGYAGYQGAIELARTLDRALHSPVWEQVRRRPTWRRPALLERRPA